ncbi:hypothetical protein ElyMa_007021100 [Elysia marginata]|uniref:Uncharacterized protein n=1 Tax=Elysia marginata TaxID=1093978 RepID=A0AAV4JW97_9GAST|nr:hypothetical protein ElyMa_007021100 [Elysia marginata]
MRLRGGARAWKGKKDRDTIGRLREGEVMDRQERRVVLFQFLHIYEEDDHDDHDDDDDDDDDDGGGGGGGYDDDDDEEEEEEEDIFIFQLFMIIGLFRF